LKGICTAEEWDVFKEYIHFDYIKDNNFSELKEAELITNRLQVLAQVDPYTGRYFSDAWIQRNVLRMNDDEIKRMNKEIEKEKAEGGGLPVAVTNDMAAQQASAEIQDDSQATMAQHQAQIDQDAAAHQNELDIKAAKAAPKPKPTTKKEDVSNTFHKLKRIL
jgi:hypothetical protein